MRAPGARGVRGARGDRPVRPDARRDAARRRRQAAAPGDPVERRPLVRRMRRARAPRARRRTRSPAIWSCPASRRRSCCGSRHQSRRPSAATKRVLLPKDYVRLRLTGEAVSDMSDSAGTLLARRRRAALGREPARRDRPHAVRTCRASSKAREVSAHLAPAIARPGGWRAERSRSPAAAATMRPPRSASARSRPARASFRSAPRA